MPALDPRGAPLNMRFPAALLSLPFLASFQSAPSLTDWYGENHTSVFPWSAPLSQDAFGRTVTGRYREPHAASAALLAGDRAYFLWAPADFSSAADLPVTAVTELAHRPGSGSGLDTILAANASGLHELRWNAGTSAFDAAPLGDSAWANARRVLVRDLDHAFGPDVIGLSADGSTALVMLATASGFAPTTSLSLATAADDLVPLDFLAGASDEFVIRSDSGIHIYRLDGSLFTFVPTAGSGGGAIARIDAPGDPTSERLAWVDPTLSGAWKLRVLDRFVMDAPVPLVVEPYPGHAAAAVEPYALAPCDWNGDGRTDLALVHGSFRAAPILLNQGPTQSFLIHQIDVDHVVVPLGPQPGQPAGMNTGLWTAAAFEGYASEGLLVPVDATSEVYALVQPDPLTSSLGGPAPGAQASVPAVALHNHAGYAVPFPNDGVPGPTATLTLYFESIPWSSVIPNYTHLQAVVWEQPDPLVDPNISHVASRNHLFSFPSSTDDVDDRTQAIEIELRQHLETCFSWDDRRHRYIQLRFVNVDPVDGTLGAPSASVFLGVALDVGTTDSSSNCVSANTGTLPVDYFLAGFNPQPDNEEVRVDLDQDYIPGYFFGSTLTGVITVIDYTPTIRPNRTPQLPSATPGTMLPWNLPNE